jgi:threonine dehydrogenase-like Zn-dependent dehydrogenase
MDSPRTGDTVRALTTDGNGTFFESIYTIPELHEGDILVKAVMTGVCRSDVAMMQGEFQLLPASMHGHEGLGIDVASGDYVATRGEPAYADYYVARAGTFVKVPAAEPQYIVEPVACGINVILNSLDELKKRRGKRMLIIGTGFLARIAHQTIKNYRLEFDIDVVGHSNVDYWETLYSTPPKKEYDVVIDLSERNTLELVNLADNGLIIMAAEKSTGMLTSFGDWLWKNVTVQFPSPRALTFIESMSTAVNWITEKKLNLDNIWTCGYSRNNNWKQAFEDAVNRPENYSRGYIIWD